MPIRRTGKRRDWSLCWSANVQTGFIELVRADHRAHATVPEKRLHGADSAARSAEDPGTSSTYSRAAAALAASASSSKEHRGSHIAAR